MKRRTVRSCGPLADQAGRFHRPLPILPRLVLSVCCLSESSTRAKGTSDAGVSYRRRPIGGEEEGQADDDNLLSTVSLPLYDEGRCNARGRSVMTDPDHSPTPFGTGTSFSRKSTNPSLPNPCILGTAPCTFPIARENQRRFVRAVSLEPHHSQI